MRDMHPRSRSGAALVVVALLASTIAACRPGALAGTGPEVSVSRTVPAFDRIEAGAGIAIVATIGPLAPLTVRARQSIEPVIRTEVRDGTLHVDARARSTRARWRSPSPCRSSSASRSAVARTPRSRGWHRICRDRGRRWRGRRCQRCCRCADPGRGRWIHAPPRQLTVEHADMTLAGGADAVVRVTGDATGEVSGGAHLRLTGGGTSTVGASGGGEVVVETAATGAVAH